MTDPPPPTEPRQIAVALNGLRWLQAEEVMRHRINQGPDHENLLRFLHAPFSHSVIEDFVLRYRTLTEYDATLFAAPVNERISRGIMQPLHNAKAAFVLGHFASCIGLCGVTVEMLAIFRFEIADVRCGDQPLDEDRQRALWGSAFERLNQGVRTTALFALGLIDQPTLELFKRVTGIRNKYMHFLSRDAVHEEADAAQVYKATAELTARIFGIGLSGSTVTLHPDVVRFLERSGGVDRTGPA
ncbi:MAG: hypothetical protein IPJ77_24490 [Planctomycetes bacterium]|nr:hypothetical protein [Planctomycetota bacterium]